MVSMSDAQMILKIKDFLLIFTSIFYEALPFIVVGALVAGMLEEFLPGRLLTRWFPKHSLFGAVLGAGLGIVFPMCECGIVPIMRRLLRKGLPLGSCVAYLLAGPVINPVVLFSTFFAFSGMGENPGQLGGTGMTVLRAAMAYLVAVTTSLFVHAVYSGRESEVLVPLKGASEDENNRDMSLLARFDRVTAVVLHDFVDISFFLILGALMSASVRLFYSQEDISAFSLAYPIPAIGLMMLLAFLLCLCSEADAFVAASFVKMVPAAKASFLVFGPMMDIKLLLMYTRVFRRNLIVFIVALVAVQTFFLAVAYHLLTVGLGSSG